MIQQQNKQKKIQKKINRRYEMKTKTQAFIWPVYQKP